MKDHDERSPRSREGVVDPAENTLGKGNLCTGELLSKGTVDFSDSEFNHKNDLEGQSLEDAGFTETIDLTSLFSKSLSATGSFDIRGDIWRTTFGQVLQALPIPAFLIDQDSRIIFVNQACSKISSSYEEILGVPFPSLFPSPVVSRKVQLFLEDVFSSRKTKVGQAVLQMKQSKIWARFTLRSVRIMRERHILVLIEDLTSEKKQIQLKEKFNQALEQRVVERTAALKDAKDALQEGEERFRGLVESTDDWFWERDVKGVYTYASPRVKELLGYEPQEVLGKVPSELVPRKMALRFESKLQSIVSTGKPFRGLETVAECKDGSLVVIETSGVPFFDSRGKLLGYRGIDRDITYRKQAEEALRKSEEKYRLLADNTLDLIWQTDLDLRFTYVNPAISRITGHTPDEVIGSKLSEYCDAENFMKMAEVAAEEVSKGADSSGAIFDAVVLSKNKDPVSIEVRGKIVLDKNGEPKALQGVARDIGYRKQAEEALRKSEEKYRTILETIADGYHETDLKGNLTLVNDSLCEILGYSREELLNMNYRELMDEANAKRTYEAYNKVYSSGHANQGFDVEVLRKNGVQRQVSVSIAPVLDAEQHISGFRGVFRDVTEHRLLEEQLKQAAKMEAVGRLAGGIAHDFNNLLTAIIGYANLLMDQVQDNDVQHNRLTEIARAADRAATLTSQLLAYGRRQVLDTRVLDISEVVSAMEEMLRRIIGEDINLVTIHSSELGLVRADSGQIEQVLMNLAVNARDAMPNGGELIIETADVLLDENYCRTHPGVEPGPYVMCTVSDNGLGMEQEIVSRIFDPFFTTKEQGVGTGLGLATAYGIVRQHRGHVAVYSLPDQGTIFKVYLPRVQDSRVEIRETASSAPRPQGKETVLVVEDEEIVRNLTCEILDTLGYCTLSAGDPAQAQAVSRNYEGTIHLLLTDVILPQIDGRSLYRALATERPEMKVVYCSGYTEQFVVHQGVLDQNVHFLAKPFNVDALAKKVREILDGP